MREHQLSAQHRLRYELQMSEECGTSRSAEESERLHAMQRCAARPRNGVVGLARDLLNRALGYKAIWR
jgi:hypothetical protein